MKMNDYEIKHSKILRKLGAECTVLLKRNGDFPLKEPCQLALYGSGARNTIKGGTGSGEVNSRFFISVEKGLEKAGFEITTKNWLDSYDKVRGEARKQFVKEIKARAKEKHVNPVVEGMGAVMPEPSYRLPLTGEGTTAVYVLSRISGEGSDREATEGDIFLTPTEIRDILALRKKYEKFMLVLNVGGPVDLEPVHSVENILVLSQLGVVTGIVLADILLGKSNPSGKLATTWSDWKDYPKIGEFGDINDTRYTEGIYVGYRYFDSVGKRARFPFGFGLSYTSFQTEMKEICKNGKDITVKAAVTNTGDTKGKEVLQLYVSVPGGKMDKPYQQLAAWAKTRELHSGETEELSLTFDVRDLASYDEMEHCFVLERGDYILRLGNSSVDTAAVGIVRSEETIKTRVTKACLGKADFTDWKPDKAKQPEGEEDFSEIPVVLLDAADIPTVTVDYDETAEIDPRVRKLKDEQLAYMNLGLFDPKGGLRSIVGNAAVSVAGAAGETTNRVKGFPGMVMADGPAGLRLCKKYIVDKKGVHALGESMPETFLEFMPKPAAWAMRFIKRKPKATDTVHEQYATAIPIGTAIASGWNLALAEQCGDIVGAEMERFGVHLWLAPALNIHRSVLCGRNFEYFSEDPLISGKFAAALTKGVQKHPGCGTTIKHFAANNQETNRYNNNSQVSERAMREIYLKGFEICIRESQPLALMTSYNLLNGIHTSERRDLIEDVLRREFGFCGIVMTDWIVNGGTVNKASVHPAPDAAKIAMAGGDLTMPGSKKDFACILAALSSGTLSREQLMINATRVLHMAERVHDKK